MAKEKLDPHNSKVGDTRETYFIGVEGAPLNHALASENMWPNEEELGETVKNWKKEILQYFDAVHALGMRMMRILSLSLNLPANHFDKNFTQPMHGMVPVHYSAVKSQPGEGAFACGAHSDYGMMTFLTTDDVPGLEVLVAKDGSGVRKKGAGEGENEYVPVTPMPNNFVCNIGDMLMRWTNDTYVSTMHRVVNREGRERYSIPFFFEPNFETLVECIPQCCSAENPAKYEPITSGDYKLFKHLEAHDELREKVEK